MSGENSFSIKDRRRVTGDGETASAEKEAPATSQSGPAKEKEPEKKSAPPPITFSTFVLSLSTSAAMNLGGYQDPVSGHVPRNLELAKQSIDILGIIKDKTNGNLDADESSLLESVLYELRMRYIDEMKKGA